MLANSADDVAEALSRFGEGAWEYKLDGARIQVHKGDGDVRIFTRQLQDVTDRLPEVVASVRAFPGRDMILEGEAIALRADGRPQPFQITMRRLGRRKDVASMQQDIPCITTITGADAVAEAVAALQSGRLEVYALQGLHALRSAPPAP